MDPYLEQYWGDVHHRLCTYGCDLLRRVLPAGLITRIDERTIIEDDSKGDRVVIPDVRVVQRGQNPSGNVAMLEVQNANEPMIIEVENEPITEGFIQVIDVRNGGRIITVIEFASPANKMSGTGREMYSQKQHELLQGGVSLVEVDLIRSGKWNMLAPEAQVTRRGRGGVYHVCVTRAWRHNRYEVYPIKLQERLPTIRIPLRRTDQDAVLDMQALIDQVYENGSYGYDMDYTNPPIPPLAATDADWAATLL